MARMVLGAVRRLRVLMRLSDVQIRVTKGNVLGRRNNMKIYKNWVLGFLLFTGWYIMVGEVTNCSNFNERLDLMFFYLLSIGYVIIYFIFDFHTREVDFIFSLKGIKVENRKKKINKRKGNDE